MTWYLTIRALCVVAFVAGVCCLFGSACMAEEGKRQAAQRWVAYAFGFLILGCALIGLGWTPEHP